MRYAVITAYDQAQAEFGDLTAANKRRYAEAHGYDFHCDRQPLTGRQSHWMKQPMIRRHLAQYDWLFWTDADSVIMNRAMRLTEIEDSAADVILTEDWKGINTGQMLIRNTRWSHTFFRDVWRTGQLPNRWGWHEQFTIRTLLEGGEIERNRIRDVWSIKKRNDAGHGRVIVLPQRTFNSYPEVYQGGDFVIHFPGDGQPKLQLVRRCLRNECDDPQPEARVRHWFAAAHQ